MKAIKTALDGVILLEPKVFGDARGFFFESFNQAAFDAVVGFAVSFVQDNHSHSTRGVLRGLHFQKPPHAQGKLVRVTQGSVFDVVVDVRAGSPTYGRWIGHELSADNFRQLWIPPGFAHGFLVTSDIAEFLYKTTSYYVPEAEASLRWNDSDLGIAWPDTGSAPSLSAKDAAAMSLQQLSRD